VELDRIDLPDAFSGTGGDIGAGSLVRVGPYLYVTDGASSLLVIDASNPADLRLEAILPANDRSELVLDFPSLYVTDEVGVYDVSDPGSPRLVREVSGGGSLSGDEGLAVGDKLFMLASFGNVKIFDVADLSTDAATISYPTDTDPLHVSALPGHLVVGVEDLSATDESGLPQSGLRIYSIEYPLSPILVQIDSTRNTIYDFDAQGAYAAAIGGSGNPTDLLIYGLE
jgi:hypothetical protein